MLAKQIEKINCLINDAQMETQNNKDSVSLISKHMGRTTSTAPSRIRPKSVYRIQRSDSKDRLPQNVEEIMKGLFKAKCKDMHIEFNKQSWCLFVKAFLLKNKIREGQISRECLNLSHFSLGPSCISHLNILMRLYQFDAVNLTKNIIDPTKLQFLVGIKQIVLDNCRLGNEKLQCLFELLLDSQVEKISLSSPELKDRNQLTRYEKLIELIKESKTLTALNLSNIEIQPENGIMQASKMSCLKHLDLSDNNSVRGISPNLLSLNLSRNSISVPFDLPLTPCLVQSLNLSYNKIPFYQFKSFLKNINFPNLKELVLDHIQLNGPIESIQRFIDQSLSLSSLSVVECDLSEGSYFNITNGVRYNRSLKFVDLSRNRVSCDKIAQNVSLMLQGGTLTALRMRYCDIKDNFGAIIFNGLQRSHFIQSIDMMNNLLGDQTARTICRELKKAKSVLQLRLDQNIIKYKDRQEIESYLLGNKHLSKASLKSQYKQLSQLSKQQDEVQRKSRQQDERLSMLQEETDELEKQFFQKFLINNEQKKLRLLEQINRLREEQTFLQQELFIRETLLVPSLSCKQSEFNPEIEIPSPTR